MAIYPSSFEPLVSAAAHQRLRRAIGWVMPYDFAAGFLRYGCNQPIPLDRICIASGIALQNVCCSARWHAIYGAGAERFDDGK
jgi:hypothetical protein